MNTNVQVFANKHEWNSLILLKDINECAVSNGGCNQACINTQGSYQCQCSTGFTMLANLCQGT